MSLSINTLDPIADILSFCQQKEDQLEENLNAIQTKSSSVLPEIDYKKMFQIYYRNEEYLDFDFKLGANEESVVSVHKLFLILNECTNLYTFVGQSMAIQDVSQQLFRKVIDCFYGQDFDIKDVNEGNIDELIKIGEHLGNERLNEMFGLMKHRLDLMTDIKDIEDVKAFIATKRKSISNDSMSNKRQKLSNEKWKPIPDYKPLETESNTSATNGDNSLDQSDCLSDCDNQLIIDLTDKECAETTADQSIASKLNYRIDKYDTLDPKSIETKVWNSSFVPKKSKNKEHQLVAVVGETKVIWINLDKEYERVGEFDATKGHKFRCIAFTQQKVKENVVNICAVGSDNCIYFCKEPNASKVVETYCPPLTGFNDEVMDITFHTTRPNWMFCGTADKRIMIFELKFKSDGLLDRNETAARIFEHSAPFPIISIIYVQDFDSLIASGESGDLILLYEVSKVNTNNLPIIRRIHIGNRKIKSISGLVYIPQNKLIAIRSHDLEFINTGELNKIIDKLIEGLNSKDSRRLTNGSSDSNSAKISFFSWNSLLKYSKPLKAMIEPNLYMSYNQGFIAIGDHFGKIFVFNTNEIFRRTQTEPHLLLGDIKSKDNKPLIVLSANISDDKRFIISTTHSNLICIWKLTDQ